MDKNVYNLLWVIEFLVFEEDEEIGIFLVMYYLFILFMDEDLDKLEEGDKLFLRVKVYDIVLNGYEIGGGSVRILNFDV